MPNHQVLGIILVVIVVQVLGKYLIKKYNVFGVFLKLMALLRFPPKKENATV